MAFGDCVLEQDKLFKSSCSALWMHHIRKCPASKCCYLHTRSLQKVCSVILQNCNAQAAGNYLGSSKGGQNVSCDFGRGTRTMVSVSQTCLP